MKITVTTNRTSIAVQYGFIGFKLDFNEIESSVETLKTIAKTFVDMDARHEANFTKKTDQIINYIQIAKECILIESSIEDWETIMELDINDQTLVGKAKFIKLPIQDKDMSITIDYMKIGKLIQELSTFDLNPPEEEQEEENKTTDTPLQEIIAFLHKNNNSNKLNSDYARAWKLLINVFPNDEKEWLQRGYRMFKADLD